MKLVKDTFSASICWTWSSWTNFLQVYTIMSTSIGFFYHVTF